MDRSTEFLRVKESASLLGVAPNTVRAWVGGGKIPEYRHPINRFRLYKKSKLEKVLRQIENPRPGRSGDEYADG